MPTPLVPTTRRQQRLVASILDDMAKLSSELDTLRERLSPAPKNLGDRARHMLANLNRLIPAPLRDGLCYIEPDTVAPGDIMVAVVQADVLMQTFLATHAGPHGWPHPVPVGLGDTFPRTNYSRKSALHASLDPAW